MVIPELGVAPLEDSGTDLEDELATPDGSPSTDASKPVLGPTTPGVDLELARALLELGFSSNRVSLQVPAKTGGGTCGDGKH